MDKNTSILGALAVMTAMHPEPIRTSNYRVSPKVKQGSQGVKNRRVKRKAQKKARRTSR